METQHDAFEFLEAVLGLAFNMQVINLMQNDTSSSVVCLTPGCAATVTQPPLSNWTLKVHVPVFSEAAPQLRVVVITDLLTEVLDHVEPVVWTCPTCGALSGLSTDTVGATPQYLVVQLVRTWAGATNRTRVHVQKELLVQGKKYFLRAAVYFTGTSPVRGHYVTSIHRENGDEWLQDDERTSDPVDVGLAAYDATREELVVGVVYEARGAGDG